jgi:hypothetical protein
MLDTGKHGFASALNGVNFAPFFKGQGKGAAALKRRLVWGT